MKDFEEIGKGMPYSMPEGFMDDVTEKICARIAAPVESRHRGKSFAIWGSVAAVAAVALALVIPTFSNFGVPDYDQISQCKSIDEVFQSMSVDDMELYSMMSNYYGE